MTTVEYLSQIRRITVLIENKVSDIKGNLAVIKENAYGLSGVRYDSDRVQTSNCYDPTSTTAIRLVALEQEALKQVDGLIAQRKEIVKQIESVPDTEQYDVLFKRYVLNRSVGEIARERDFSRRQTNRLLQNAISCFEDLYGEQYL